MFNEAINYFFHNCYKYKILKQNEYNKFEQSHCSTLQENEIVQKLYMVIKINFMQFKTFLAKIKFNILLI